MTDAPVHKSLLLEGLEDFQTYSLRLAQTAYRQLAIYSRSLDAAVYDNQPMADAISTLARRSRHTRIQILVKDTNPLVEHGHRLARLCQRLPSTLSLRKLVREPDKGAMSYMLCDTQGLLYKNDEDDYRGFFNLQAAPQVKRLREEFDLLWQYAEPEPRLQHLYI